jgi:hypothetical protein
VPAPKVSAASARALSLKVTLYWSRASCVPVTVLAARVRHASRVFLAAECLRAGGAVGIADGLVQGVNQAYATDLIAVVAAAWPCRKSPAVIGSSSSIGAVQEVAKT